MRCFWLLLLLAGTQGEENFCSGLNAEDTRICKIVINKFISIVFKSSDFESIRQQSTGNATIPSYAREKELISELEQSRQRENDLIAQMMIAKQREAEANTRLQLALQREKELKLKLELSSLWETEINLAGLRNLQNSSKYNNIKLKLSTQEIKYLASIELRLLTALENLNRTLMTCEQNVEEKSLQFNTVLGEVTGAKIRLGIIQENLNNTRLKLENCQIQHRDAKSQLVKTDENFSAVRKQLQQCQNAALQPRDNHERNVTSPQVSVEERFRECRTNGKTLTINPPGDAVNLSTGTYYFDRIKRSWKDARISCLCRGMDLVAIESEEENRAIFEHVVTLGGNFKNFIHTSGHYSMERQEFIWQSTKQPLTYSNWFPGQPNTKGHFASIYFRITTNGSWWIYSNVGEETSVCELL